MLKKEAKAKHSDIRKVASRKSDNKYLSHSRLSLQRKKQLAALLFQSTSADDEALELWNKKNK